MASRNDSSVSKRDAWTPQLNHKMFIALLDTLGADAINYDAIAERVGGGHTKKSIYKRIYDLKTRQSMVFTMSSAPEAVDFQKTKKRKRDSNGNGGGGAV